mmetsp:Transcript_12241/g.27821  ORF Transcript_12241/g.27821 Transcript_12241/m.27821 type:complete len:219 (-) Transcript_12241:524-1180(-)
MSRFIAGANTFISLDVAIVKLLPLGACSVEVHVGGRSGNRHGARRRAEIWSTATHHRRAAKSKSAAAATTAATAATTATAATSPTHHVRRCTVIEVCVSPWWTAEGISAAVSSGYFASSLRHVLLLLRRYVVAPVHAIKHHLTLLVHDVAVLPAHVLLHKFRRHEKLRRERAAVLVLTVNHARLDENVHRLFHLIFRKHPGDRVRRIVGAARIPVSGK